ncbi:ergothioneine biosynthesis protein EgtC [Catellatospora tritici]|uniref:ergothioneine biosynthesis protein EgtC n=1 Tax=Catellatospora tritici TaxID=2851566 RepID=UPI001C2DBABA|nr:ergothioneine biosynthesis protein EgtC [Catellatospora tritici]MBV1851710.1 ergothioneine biosynthesis protein EgtC [Catellatospora tritici]
MCRHLVYLGPPTPLAALLVEPPYGLVHQSWAPRDMRGGGTINVDGFGVGWFTPSGPVRYRRGVPIWGDQNFGAIARQTMVSAALAAVRSATPGMVVNDQACAPFGGEGWWFSLNGFVAGWPDSVAKLAERLPVTDLMTMDAPTDAAFLWVLLRQRLRAGYTPAEAVTATVAEVGASAAGSRLNLLLTDGEWAYATTYGHALSVRHDPGRVIVASEPFDDDSGWVGVPDRRLVVAHPASYTVEEL